MSQTHVSQTLASLNGPVGAPPSREQVLAWMRQLGLHARSNQPALEQQVLGLAERLTGRSYLTAQERAALASAAAPALPQALEPAPAPGAAEANVGLWNASEGEMAADGFVRRLADSAEGRRRRAEVLYRINRLDRVVSAEGYAYSASEVKEMRVLSHRHFPGMFRVHLLHSVARRDDAIGAAARLEIAKTVLRNDLLQHIQREQFLVSYGFGSRDFDALFEMGDGHKLRDALIDAAREDDSLRAGLRQLGWEESAAPAQRARG